MDGEVERLFYEADPTKRGKISTRQLEIMFKRMGITIAVKDIRGLIFQYDKTKSEDLDLHEFRQLICGIITSEENMGMINIEGKMSFSSRGA